MACVRVSVTLPADLVEEIDRRERNRSRFMLEAARRELLRRQRDELRRSLANPHPRSLVLADAGLEGWGAKSRVRSADLLKWKSGRPVRWVPGKGWTSGRDSRR